MTLARRTLLSFGWVITLTAMAGGYILYVLDEVADRNLEERRIDEALEHARFMEAAALRTILLLEQYVDSPEAAKLDQLRDVRQAAARHRKALRSITSLPRIIELLDAYEELQPKRLELAEGIIAEAKAGGDLVFLRQSRDGLDRRVQRYLEEIVDIENRAMAASVEQTLALGRELRRNTVVLLALVLGLALLVSVLTVRNISRRLLPLLEMSREVSRGNFEARVVTQRSDEVSVLARSFNDMAEQLGELDKVKDEFVALASHQLRTPATAVKANLAMLLDGYFGAVTAEQREYLKDAYDSNERQLDVIDDILNAARAGAGRLVLECAEVDLAQLVREVLGEHRFGIEERGQRLEVDMPPAAVRMTLDKRKMKMVIDNLVSNASKYTPGGGSIRVGIVELPDHVTVEVADSGVGIAAQDVARIFRKFSRVDNPLSVSSGGTGLGLYLAGEIVRLHAGEIMVQSEPGRGSTFRVQLPRR